MATINEIIQSAVDRVKLKGSETWIKWSFWTRAKDVELNSGKNVETAVSELDENISNEIDRATDRENEIETALNSEITRAKSAESTLSTSINNEITRAKNAENTLETNKVPITRTINGKALSSDITLSASDVGADASGSANTALTNAKAYTDTKVADLVGTAPETLDTLEELADALKDNADIVDVLNEAITSKASAVDLTSHASNNTAHITADERTAWNDKASKYEWTAKIKGQTWSRIFQVISSIPVVGTSSILSVTFTRGFVVCNATFMITTSHSKKCFITQLNANSYSPFKIRGVANTDGDAYIELYDDERDITTDTEQVVFCRLIPLRANIINVYTEFVDGTTVPTDYTANDPLTVDITGGSMVASKFVGNADTATKLEATSMWNVVYQTSDTHILKLGYWKCTFDSYDNLVIMFTSSFWGNQHCSSDIISLAQDLNDNSTGSVHCTLSRLKLMDSTREFYYKIDDRNKRIYLYVYVKGGNSYGSWNSTIIQSHGGSWVSEYATNQTKESTFVAIAQPTTYTTGDSTTAGLTKLYAGTGTNTDGAMTQGAITTALNGKAASSHTHNYAGSSSAGGAATTALACTGNAATATCLTNSYTYNTRPTSADDFDTFNKMGIMFSSSSMTTNKPNSDGAIIQIGWDNPSSPWNNTRHQLFIPHDAFGNMQYRGWQGSDTTGTWWDWRTLLDTNNYTSYTVKKDGTGASGTWGIGVTGNAATATKLKTARTISLTGSVTGSGTFDGSGNLSIATTTNHTHNYLPLSGGTLTGNLTMADTKNIMLRTNETYSSGICYDTKGNECISLWAKNAVTRLRWNAGVDMSTMVSGKMMDITPDFEISKASGSAMGYIAGTRIVTNSGTWGISVTGNAATATKLKTARNIKVNLGSTSAASFDGSGDATVGVTGTLGAGNGGTGKTSLQDSANALINSLERGTSEPQDNDYFVSQYAGGTQNTFHRRPVSALWGYIKGKISSVLGISTSGWKLSGSTANADTYITAERADTGVSVAFGVGSGGINHGLWSHKLDKWMVYGDASNVYLNGNSATATKLATARTISLTGSVTGSGSFDGSGNLSIATTTNHTHNYLPLSGGTLTGTLNTENLLPDGNYSVGNASHPYNYGYFKNAMSDGFYILDTYNSPVASLLLNTSTDVMYYSGNDLSNPKNDVIGLSISSGMYRNMRLHGQNIRLQSENYISSNVKIAMASDEKVKSFTTDIDTDEEKLVKLFDIIKPKSYSYKYVKSDDSLNIGFSAQEIEQAMIDLDIDPEKYGILNIQYGHTISRGNDFEDGKYYTKFYEISYNDLFNLSLLKTRMMEKEHVERLVALEEKASKLDELEARLSALENK